MLSASRDSWARAFSQSHDQAFPFAAIRNESSSRTRPGRSVRATIRELALSGSASRPSDEKPGEGFARAGGMGEGRFRRNQRLTDGPGKH